jgi:hypothetical protein
MNVAMLGSAAHAISGPSAGRIDRKSGVEMAACLQQGSMIDAEPERELFSIVVPVFNATTTLDQLVQRIAAVFAGLPQFDHEIIFVDDASIRPETWPTLKRIALGHGHVRAVQLMRNFGQTPATFCGMSLARGHYIIPFRRRPRRR